ncbi:MAG: peptidase M64 [Planctomycetia bacterium]|nr:peptidase M64 [Planctomycetia bacterium]
MYRILLFILSIGLSQNVIYNDFFTDNTLRFDYFHSGVADTERVSLDELRLENAWPGSKTNLIDKMELGLYRVEVVDIETNKLIYSYAFASIFGEWQTTGEAADGIWRTFHESQRFPEPKQPFRLILKKRNPDGSYNTIYDAEHDPTSRFVNRSPIANSNKVREIFNNGSPENKVDILILGDGYRKEDVKQFKKDAKHLVGVLFDTEPFKSRKSDFNVWAMNVFSDETGISNPRQNVWKKSTFDLRFNSFDSDRYVLTFANKNLREIAAQAPYDAIMIIFNDPKYGGGGIYNLYSTVSSLSSQADYVFVHEFGHSFASLADEYYTSNVAYVVKPPEFEPNDPNVTALFDPDNLKWQHLEHLVAPGIPLPTPWNQAAYDSIAVVYQQKRRQMIADGVGANKMETLFDELKRSTIPMLKSQQYYGKVGAFEGGGYLAKGIYRPEVDCIMFSRNRGEFCKVCSEAIEKMIDWYVE